MQSKMLRKLQRTLSLMLTLAMLFSSFALSGLTLSTFADEGNLPDPDFPEPLGDGNVVEATEDLPRYFYLRGSHTAAKWNRGTVAGALGLTGGEPVDVKITVDYYFINATEGDEYPEVSDHSWWLNTYKPNGEGASGPNGNGTYGWGSLTNDYGMTTNAWKRLVVERKGQAFGGETQTGEYGDLLFQTFDTWNPDSEIRIAYVKIEATDANNETHTGEWGAPYAEAELPRANLMAAQDGTKTRYHGMDVLQVSGKWAYFNLGVDAGVYDMDVTFYYASTNTPWWQIQLSGANGDRYTETYIDENGDEKQKYQFFDGFQTNGNDWLTNSQGEWTSGTVSFKQAQMGKPGNWERSQRASEDLPADQRQNGAAGYWQDGFDFGFFMNQHDDSKVYICGIKFDIKAADGTVTTKMWGEEPNFSKNVVTILDNNAVHPTWNNMGATEGNQWQQINLMENYNDENVLAFYQRPGNGGVGAMSWWRGRIADLLKVASDTKVTFSMYVDYQYVNPGENDTVALRTINAAGTFFGENEFNNLKEVHELVSDGEWHEARLFERAEQVLGTSISDINGNSNLDDLYVAFGGFNENTRLYVRGIKFVVENTDGNTYTGLWGSYVKTASVIAVGDGPDGKGGKVDVTEVEVGKGVTATPEDGYKFDGWYVNNQLISKDDYFVFEGGYDGTIEAHFKKIVKITVNGNGKVSRYKAGVDDEVTATANDGYKFDGWYANGVKIENAGATYTVTNAYDAIEARFVERVYKWDTMSLKEPGSDEPYVFEEHSNYVELENAPDNVDRTTVGIDLTKEYKDKTTDTSITFNKVGSDYTLEVWFYTKAIDPDDRDQGEELQKEIDALKAADEVGNAEKIKELQEKIGLIEFQHLYKEEKISMILQDANNDGLFQLVEADKVYDSARFDQKVRLGQMNHVTLTFTMPENLAKLVLKAQGDALNSGRDVNVTSMKLYETADPDTYIEYKAEPTAAQFDIKMFDYIPNGFLFEVYDWIGNDAIGANYALLFADNLYAADFEGVDSDDITDGRVPFISDTLVDGHPVYSRYTVERIAKTLATVGSNYEPPEDDNDDPNAEKPFVKGEVYTGHEDGSAGKDAFDAGNTARKKLVDTINELKDRYSGGEGDTTVLGSYADTLDKLGGEGNWGKHMNFFAVPGDDSPVAETLFDYAYCMLNNLFVEDSNYNLLVDDIDSMKMQATSDKVFAFDSGWGATVEDGVVKNDGIISPYYTEMDGYAAPKQFFVLDGRGFDDRMPGISSHNYNFAMSGEGLFVYKPGMEFTFTGDDDLLLYINGQLVVNLSGLHNRTVKNLELDAWADRLNLVEGLTYPIQFFYMERHTYDSNMKIVTSIDAVPSTLDVDKFAYRDSSYTNAYSSPVSECDMNADAYYEFVVGAEAGNATPVENISINDAKFGLEFTTEGLKWNPENESDDGVTVELVLPSKDDPSGYKVFDNKTYTYKTGDSAEKLAAFEAGVKALLLKGVWEEYHIRVRGLVQPGIKTRYENTVYVSGYSNNELRTGKADQTLVPQGEHTIFPVDFNMPLTVTKNEAFAGVLENFFNPADVTVKFDEGTDKFGTVQVNGDGSITYTLNKEMRDKDKFTFTLTGKVKTDEGTEGEEFTMPAEVVFVPANNVFYESGFMVDQEWAEQNGEWTFVNDAENPVTGLNHSDRLPDGFGYGGNSGLNGVTREPNAVYSNGTGDKIGMKFAFQGTMIDIYARTTSKTGVVRAILRDKDGKALQMQIVDCEYHTDDEKGFCEIPVIHFDCTGYNEGKADEYIIDMFVLSNGDFSAEDRPLFVFDGIRVYNPMWGKGDNDVFNRFNQDNELGSKFIQLRQVMLAAEDGEYYGEGGTGVYFIDYVNPENKDTEGHEFGIDEYTNFGPKNEVYLYKNQSIAFTAPKGVNVQIGAKSPSGKQVSFTVTGSDDTETTITTGSTMDMYYLVGETHDEAVTYVITCNGDDTVLALTNLKLTTNVEVDPAMLADFDIDLVDSQATAKVALGMLNGRQDIVDENKAQVNADDTSILPSTNENLATMGGVRGECEETVAD